MNELQSLLYYLTHSSDLAQLSVLLMVVIIIAGTLKLFKQPLIIGYLLAGVIVGPLVLGLVEASADGHSFLELFSHLGIALLLFMVGVELNLDVIKEQGKTALGVGCIQIVASVLIGYGMSYVLGYDIVTSLFLALGLTFSSTIVIVKLLGDKEEEQTVYGKMSIGVLIVQDVVVMLVMMGMALRGGGDGESSVMFVEGLLLLASVVAFAKFVLPRLVKRLVQSEEFLLLIGIGRCLLLGTLFHVVGFSFEIGCLLAGMSFATSPFRMQLVYKLKPLRDFFIVLFFIALGLKLSRDGLGDHLGLLIGSVIFVMLIKPLLIYLSCVKFGYTHQVAFKSATSLGQISEFGFIILSIALGLGLITDQSLMSVMVLVGLITIALSSYITMHNNELFALVQKYTGKEKVKSTEEILSETLNRVEVVLFGYGRIGSKVAERLNTTRVSHVVIDHNPELINQLEERRGEYVFADASSLEVYKHFFHDELKMIISTIRDLEDDLFIIQQVQAYNPDIIIVVFANRRDRVLQLYEAGADYVVMTEALGAESVGDLIEQVGFDVETFALEKAMHVQELRK